MEITGIGTNSEGADKKRARRRLIKIVKWS